jgi:Domain of unknown function (DUF4249)
LIKNYFRPTIGLLLILLLVQCKQEYIPQIKESDIKLLVVEGYINSGQGPTTIRLSRVADLADTASIPEFAAQVNIESDNGGIFTLTDNGNGEYTIPQLILDNGAKYRVSIRTINGKEYVSDYSPVKHTPIIDSITWQRENEGVQIYANTHDNQNDTSYYRWAYSETWEFHSAYVSNLDYVRDPVTNDPVDLMNRVNPEAIYTCWRTQQSTNIILGSSEKLTANRIFLPIRFIEPLGEELSVRYYIVLSQYSLSHDAYRFYQRLKRNTEQIGTLFDPQPSQLITNIHCLSDSLEEVVGFVEITDQQQAHIFITNDDVKPWLPPVPCSKAVFRNNDTTLRAIGTSYLPVAPLTFRGPRIETFEASSNECVDCTLRGTNIKPTFW